MPKKVAPIPDARRAMPPPPKRFPPGTILTGDETGTWEVISHARLERSRAVATAATQRMRMLLDANARAAEALEAAKEAAELAAPFLGRAAVNKALAQAADELLLPKLVEKVLAGEVNKTLPKALGIGVEHVKRLRALAVERGLLAPKR